MTCAIIEAMRFRVLVSLTIILVCLVVLLANDVPGVTYCSIAIGCAAGFVVDWVRDMWGSRRDRAS